MSDKLTTREYLRKQGITVGQRGRFSAAAKNAIQEALKKGVVFTDVKSSKQQAWGRVGNRLVNPPPPML